MREFILSVKSTSSAHWRTRKCISRFKSISGTHLENEGSYVKFKLEVTEARLKNVSR